jgi:hypothetical protein
LGFIGRERGNGAYVIENGLVIAHVVFCGTNICDPLSLDTHCLCIACAHIDIGVHLLEGTLKVSLKDVIFKVELVYHARLTIPPMWAHTIIWVIFIGADSYIKSVGVKGIASIVC